MSVQILLPAKNKPPHFVCPSLEIVRLTPQWHDELCSFLQDIKASGDNVFFYPHPIDTASLHRITSLNGQDLYYLMVEQRKIVVYGMLRGWDEGYHIPSIGLVTHPSARRQGLSSALGDFFLVLAARRGASKIRVRVHISNKASLGLFKKMNYIFEEQADAAGLLTGFRRLKEAI
jgi:ribosomal protein S18 acetylase RimI-like enzyme